MILRIHIPSFILGYCVCAYLVKNEIVTRAPKTEEAKSAEAMGPMGAS